MEGESKAKIRHDVTRQLEPADTYMSMTDIDMAPVPTHRLTCPSGVRGVLTAALGDMASPARPSTDQIYGVRSTRPAMRCLGSGQLTPIRWDRCRYTPDTTTATTYTACRCTLVKLDGRAD